VTTTLLAAISLQTVALVIVVFRAGRSSMTTSGVVFLLMAWLYHGGAEIANVLAPGWNPYRQLVSEETIAAVSLMCGAAMCAFAIAYALIYRPQQLSRETIQRTPASVLDDWRLLSIVCLPLYILSLRPVENRPDLGYWASGLIDQFVILAFVLLSLALSKPVWQPIASVATAGPRSLAILVVQSMALAMTGTRTAVGIALAMYISARARFLRARDRQKTLAFGAAVLFIAIIVISSSRDLAGRDAMVLGATNRGRSLAMGLASLLNPTAVNEGLLADSIYRIDGNSFTALILDGQNSGTPPLGMQLLINAALVSVPSAIFPSKLDLPVEARNEKAFIISQYSLPAIDYVPTLFSMLLASFGMWGMVIAASVLGAGYATLDSWFSRFTSTRSIILSLGLVQCALQIEQGMAIYFIVFRGVLLIIFLASIVDWLRRGSQRTVDVSRAGTERTVAARRSPSRFAWRASTRPTINFRRP